MVIEIMKKRDVILPEKIAVGDWIDLFIPQTYTLKAGEYKLIPLGVAMKLPDGYEAQVALRSSCFKNFGLLMPNAPGIIDSSYCGEEDEWMLGVYCTKDITIPKDSRLCHFRLQKIQPMVEFVEVQHLGYKNRGGIGSTGV